MSYWGTVSYECAYEKKQFVVARPRAPDPRSIQNQNQGEAEQRFVLMGRRITRNNDMWLCVVYGFLFFLASKVRSLTFYTIPTYRSRCFKVNARCSLNRHASKDEDEHFEDSATEIIPNLGLRLRVGPSQVVPNQLGLYLQSDIIEPNVIPKGTPICRYATGYFTDDCKSDKSVGFLFEGSGSDMNTDLVMYQDRIMTLACALQLFWVHRKQSNHSNQKIRHDDILWGHLVTIPNECSDKKDGIRCGTFHVSPQPQFTSWVFEPFDSERNPGGAFSSLSPTQLGKFANDLAFDPSHDGVESYETLSTANNRLKLVWRLDEASIWDDSSFELASSNGISGITPTVLVPAWPMVIAKYDLVVSEQKPMEIGLEYGYHYWQAYLGKEAKQEEALNELFSS